jgi:hypothetical protein
MNTISLLNNSKSDSLGEWERGLIGIWAGRDSLFAARLKDMPKTPAKPATVEDYINQCYEEEEKALLGQADKEISVFMTRMKVARAKLEASYQ